VQLLYGRSFALWFIFSLSLFKMLSDKERNPPTKFRSIYSSKSYHLLFIGLGFVVIGLLDNYSVNLFSNLVSILLMIAGLLLTGLFFWSLGEPETAIELRESGVTLNFRRGTVTVPWNYIQRVGVPTVASYWQIKELNYIAIKVSSPEHLYEQIPLRLASDLLNKQKDLRILAIRESQLREHYSEKTSDIYNEPLVWKSKQGICLEGVAAVFAYRSERLNKFLGFHLYFPLNMVAERDISIQQAINFYKTHFLRHGID
jgi:sporulation protein YlmC with PRC-barrel domain